MGLKLPLSTNLSLSITSLTGTLFLSFSLFLRVPSPTFPMKLRSFWQIAHEVIAVFKEDEAGRQPSAKYDPPPATSASWHVQDIDAVIFVASQESSPLTTERIRGYCRTCLLCHSAERAGLMVSSPSQEESGTPAAKKDPRLRDQCTSSSAMQQGSQGSAVMVDGREDGTTRVLGLRDCPVRREGQLGL